MSQIPQQCKERAVQGAIVLALAPWCITLAFLFLSKMFLSAIVAAREVLMYGGAVIVFVIVFIQTRAEPFPRIIQSAIPAAVVGGLIYGLVELSKLGLSSTDSAINSVTASFLTFAFIGALAGAVVGGAIGYYEYHSGNTITVGRGALGTFGALGGRGRTPPHIIDHQPPRGLGNAAIDGVDALTRDPLDAARGIYRCQTCQCRYHADTMQLLSNGACTGCNSQTFTRVT